MKGENMSDFNSRYRNIDDQPDTIRTNAGPFEYGGFSNDMDIMEAENAQKKKQAARASMARGGSSARGRKAKRQMLIYGIVIAIEVIILAVIWAMYFSYNSKLSGDSDKKAAESSEEGSESGNINVDNDDFALTCTKISITTDTAGNNAALVLFTFVNKTDTPLSMSQVFAPGFKQSGVDLPTNAELVDVPQEIGNKDVQVSAGQSIECGYAVSLQDTTSELTISMRDNYETFSEIGSTAVPLN